MIRIGIVGCGRILAAHLRGYQLLREAGVDSFRITALCARRRGDAESYLQRGHGPAQRPPVGSAPGDPLSIGDVYLSDFQDDVEVGIFTDFQEMIATAEITAVNDFTTHALHHQVAQAALAAGKHLLTQKPLAVSMAAGRRMVEMAQAHDVVLGVFENARNRIDTRALGWLFQSGHLGALQLMLLTNVGNWWAPDRIVAETPWRHRKTQGGGLTLDIGVHLFNHFRFVAGEIESVEGRAEILEPLRVTRNDHGDVINRVTCDADDTILATFRTEKGATGSVTASWAGHGEGTLTGPGRGLVYYAQRGCVKNDTIQTDDGQHDDLLECYRQRVPRSQYEQHFPFGLTDAFALNQLDWLEAIRQQRAPETSGKEGLRDLAAAFAVLESSQAGRRVDVEEVYTGELRAYQRAIDEAFGLLKG